MSDQCTEFRLITDDRKLREFCLRIDGSARLAIDTEFVRERTYYPQLCLVQIATEDSIAAVDCLAGLDLDKLFATLHASHRSWVLHSARQDLEVLYLQVEQAPAELIDTQLAAALLGFPLQIGLKGLCQEVLGIEIGKEHTRMNWSRRPLPAAAIDYALDDVRYLLPLWNALAERLHDRQRLEWFREDCASALGQPIQPDTASILDRTKGAGALRGRRRAAAMALIEWREAEAQSKDLPRRWILADDVLVAIATRHPATIGELGSIPKLPRRLTDRWGKSILKALASAPEPDAEDGPAPQPNKATLRAIQALVKAKAKELGIESEVLATRRDISAAASGQLPEPFTTGWRSSILADVLNQVD